MFIPFNALKYAKLCTKLIYSLHISFPSQRVCLCYIMKSDKKRHLLTIRAIETLSQVKEILSHFIEISLFHSIYSLKPKNFKINICIRLFAVIRRHCGNCVQFSQYFGNARNEWQRFFYHHNSRFYDQETVFSPSSFCSSCLLSISHFVRDEKMINTTAVSRLFWYEWRGVLQLTNQHCISNKNQTTTEKMDIFQQ